MREPREALSKMASKHWRKGNNEACIPPDIENAEVN
jgi:hypothetical protein